MPSLRNPKLSASQLSENKYVLIDLNRESLAFVVSLLSLSLSLSGKHLPVSLAEVESAIKTIEWNFTKNGHF